VTRYGSVYLVTNTATGEQYVGQTRQKALHRWRAHILTANSKVAKKYKLSEAIISFGKEAFEFREVFTAFDAPTLDASEIALIEELKPVYNITKGGAGHRGVRVSSEVCQGRAQRLKAKWANPEWRAVQLESIRKNANTQDAVNRGKKVACIGSAARAKHVFCPELQCTFLSIADTAKHLNMSHTGIRYAIRNKIKTQDKYTLVEVVN